MDEHNFVNFLEYHKPLLPSGEYNLILDNYSLTIPGVGTQQFPAKEQKFFVQGNRYALDPSEIHSVFPPNGSRGDCSKALPHIILNRSIFPWERLIDGVPRLEKPFHPWMALLLFDEEEAPLVKTITLDDLSASTDDYFVPYFVDLAPEDILQVGEKGDDQVTVIEVPKNTLEKVMWKREDLPFSGHCRRELPGQAIKQSDFRAAFAGSNAEADSFWNEMIRIKALIPLPGSETDFLIFVTSARFKKEAMSAAIATAVFDKGMEALQQMIEARFMEDSGELQESEEWAVLVGNRFPKAGAGSVIHLVSLESCFANEAEFNYGDSSEEKMIRLVSLKSWAFSCTDPELNFAGLLKSASSSMLNLPTSGQSTSVQPYLKAGYMALPHQLRTGERTVSWYRGPLAPGNPPNNSALISLPVESADRLLIYDEKSQLLDTTYAAAWELGRQMALEDRKFSLQLYRLQRMASIKQKQEAAVTTSGYLPARDSNPIDITPLQKEVQDWLDQRRQLYDIPFPYLVPDEQLLPLESIRFFQTDAFWLRCFEDGALSLGETPKAGISSRILTPTGIPTYTGFLLRSEVVSGFPGLKIEGFTQAIADDAEHADPILPLRTERLADNVMLCLFPASIEIQTLDLFLSSESLHFGLEDPGDGSLEKDLKDIDGQETGSSYTIQEDDWRAAAARVLNLHALASHMQEQLSGVNPEFEVFTSSDFALQMMEGAPKVRFFVRG